MSVESERAGLVLGLALLHMGPMPGGVADGDGTKEEA